MKRKSKWSKDKALGAIRQAIDRGRSQQIQNTIKKEGYAVRPDVLGLNRLGAVDYLVNKCKIPITFLERRHR